MKDRPVITAVKITEFTVPLPDMGKDLTGFNLAYAPGETAQTRRFALQIHTDLGITGEFFDGTGESFSQIALVAPYLPGKDALQREPIYNDLKRALRKSDRTALGPIDIALWDIAGQFYDAPIHELLGGVNRPLPCYASTYHGDRNGGLDSPAAYADFAVQCRDMGYPGFKIHGWGDPIIEQEIATVTAVREAVGPDMDLMIDPACEYNTFADTVQVGRALDDADYFWYEDPLKDGGVSAHAHRKLRELIRTPLLQGEHVRGLEQHVDLILADATDFVRVDAYLDGGLTGAMKIAHAAEGLGLDVEIHGPGPAHRHLMTAIRNTNYYELGLVHPKAPAHYGYAYQDYTEDLDAIDENGCVFAPTGPGLGVRLDWDYIRRREPVTQVFTA
jgi:L-alanine-DL-glutamate epimerase-like enolase superfamily enzyme